MDQNNKEDNIIALDVGTVRIGLALANTNNYLANPYCTVLNDEKFQDNFYLIIKKHNVQLIIVGMPRSLNGDKTAQSYYVEKWVNDNLSYLKMKIVYQDESLTSVKAQEILNFSKNKYQKSDIDSQAAALILDDFLLTNRPLLQ